MRSIEHDSLRYEPSSDQLQLISLTRNLTIIDLFVF